MKKPTAQPAIAYGKSLGGKQQAGELFGDSGEDDDLFGSASKKIEAAKKGKQCPAQPGCDQVQFRMHSPPNVVVQLKAHLP